jgi:hypothetical protein
MIEGRSSGERGCGCDAIAGEHALEVDMARFGTARDPFWDMDGHGVRRERRREKVIGTFAFVMAVVATGLAFAAWVRQLAPVLG